MSIFQLHMISNRMRIERQIDAGRAECRLHAQAAKQINGRTSGQVYRTTESSLEEETDSDLDMGGPEGTAPPPDNDETVDETAAAQTQAIKIESDDDDDDDDEVDFALQRRRVASAPVSPSLARQRRRQIATSLGITMDKIDKGWLPAGRSRRIQEQLPTIDGSDEPFSSARQARQNTSRRRLSTGQLWLGRYNRAPAPDTAFGSGISGDEDMHSGEELNSERSYDKSA